MAKAETLGRSSRALGTGFEITASVVRTRAQLTQRVSQAFTVLRQEPVSQANRALSNPNARRDGGREGSWGRDSRTGLSRLPAASGDSAGPAGTVTARPQSCTKTGQQRPENPTRFQLPPQRPGHHTLEPSHGGQPGPHSQARSRGSLPCLCVPPGSPAHASLCAVDLTKRRECPPGWGCRGGARKEGKGVGSENTRP